MASRFRFGRVEIFPTTLNIDFMRWRKVTIGLSLFLVIASILVIAIKGVNYSIDFVGGAELAVSVQDPSYNRDKMEELAQAANVGKVEVTVSSAVGSPNDSAFVLRIQHEPGKPESATTRNGEILIEKIRSTIGVDKTRLVSVSNISGKIGKEEEYKGYMALLLSFIGILIYIGARFDLSFAPGAVLCLFHNVIIAMGVMTLFGRPFSVSSIAAFLTIVGYSINDTVIVYDRIRETQNINSRMPIVELVNRSINQTMSRTVLTSSTGLAALLVLAIYGGGAIEDFALTMFIGILVGTYSSIYVAAPLTIVMNDFLKSRGWKKSGTSDKKAVVLKDPNYIPPVIMKKRPPAQ